MGARSESYNPILRLRLLVLSGIVIFGLLGVRLAYLQLVRHPHFASVAEAQRKRASELTPHRGTIYLQEGLSKDLFPVASNRKGWIAYAVPRDMDDPAAVAEQIASELIAFRKRQQEHTQSIIAATGQQRVLGEQQKATEEEATPSPTPSPRTDEELTQDLKNQLAERFNQRTDPYEPILRPHEILDDQLRSFLEERNLPGIVLEEAEVRVYPEEELAAHVLGYVGFNDQNERVGRYGIEGFFNDSLRGDLGWLSSERDSAGGFIGVAGNEFRPAEDGDDIVLTIDRVVQSVIEKELKDGVERYGAERGSIVVMNPKTGEVLGMATYPTYDPNTYYAVNDPRVQSNPIVSDIFEPGSILKPVIMAGGIEEGTVAADTTFNDSGPVRVAEYTIDTFDNKHFGLQTMTQVLEKSNNVGMVWLAQQLGAETMYDYLRRFGFGERSGIRLAGETQTNLPLPDAWNVANVATIGFGQGIAVTPIQALNAINALANGGKLTEPHVVSYIRHQDGTINHNPPRTVRQVVSLETAGKLSAMMVSVLENGVADQARVPGYYLAGKTGTAQVADETGQYAKDKKIISFVGFGPVPDPEFSILIKLDNPSGLSFASGTAAPMFRNVAEKLLNYYQIPPSYDNSVTEPPYRVY